MSISNAQYYYINSRERTEGSISDSDFFVELKIPQFANFTHCVVTDALIPKSYYLVAEGYNTFGLVEDGSTATITIPEGNYSYRSFKSVLTDLLTTNSPLGLTYEIEVPGYNEAVTGKYMFRVTGAVTTVQFIFADNSLFEQFGFPRMTTQTFLTTDPTHHYLRSANVVKFDLEDALYLRSDLTHNQTDNVLQQLYVDVSDFSWIHYKCPDLNTHAKKLTQQITNRVKFWLTDEDGHVLSLNGLNMIFTIKLFSFPKVMTAP